MVSGPFLLPFHTLPIASFWTEWWAGALGFSAAIFGLLTLRGQSLPLSPLLFIPATMLVALLIQLAFGRLVFPQIGLLYAVYLLWASLMLILGRSLADAIGLARLVDVLAVAITLGTLISAAVALVQWLGITNHVPWVIPAPSAVWANIAQKNHYAHFCWLGIASTFYLRGRGHLSRIMLWLVVLPIGFGSTLSGSRSVFLYLLVILAALAWALRRDSLGRRDKLVADAALLLPMLVVMNFIGDWTSPRIPDFWAWAGSTFPSLALGSKQIMGSNGAMPINMLYTMASEPSSRLPILRAAWLAFLEHPWLGQGAGNFSWAIFRLGDSRELPVTHAHNFVFHLLAEFGAPTVIVVILLVAAWANRFLRQQWQLEHFWCASVLSIGAVHSLLEYPLWYSHFLGPTALLLGATDSGKVITLVGRRITFYLILVALVGALVLSKLRADYSEIEMTIYSPFAAHADREHAWQISLGSLVRLQRESLLSPWVLRMLVHLAEPSREASKSLADLCLSGIRLLPERASIIGCAMQLAIAGREADARRLTLAVLRAFPEDRSGIAEQLASGSQMFPEVKALWLLSHQQ